MGEKPPEIIKVLQNEALSSVPVTNQCPCLGKDVTAGFIRELLTPLLLQKLPSPMSGVWEKLG